MVPTAAKVDWTVVQTEVEALQLEYSWIKEFDPRFNVKYRDDKSYPWLAVTLSEEFPRVMVGRGPKRKGNRYFGPYSHAWAIRETVDLLLRVFPMRSCRPGVFKNHKQLGRPCLLGYIGKCSAPCVGRVTPEEHRAIVDDFCQFMAGQAAPMIKRLEREMRTASDELEFERAARLRDDIGALQRAMEQNAVVLPRRHRRRRDRAGRGPARGRGADLPRPRRPGPRRARLGGRPVRRERHRRADRAVPAPALRRDRTRPTPTATPSRGRSWCPRCRASAESLTELLSERRGVARRRSGCRSAATSGP